MVPICTTDRWWARNALEQGNMCWQPVIAFDASNGIIENVDHAMYPEGYFFLRPTRQEDISLTWVKNVERKYIQYGRWSIFHLEEEELPF